MYKIFTLLFLFSISSAAFSQQNNIFSSDDDYSSRLSYSNYNNKQVIDKLASSANVSGHNFNYTVNVNLKRKINKPSATLLNLIVRHNSTSLPNLSYKDFQMPSTVEPDKIDLKIKLLDGNTVLKEYPFSGKDLNDRIVKQDYTIVAGGQSTGNKSPNYTLTIVDIKISYSTTRASAFNQWTNLVDGYQNANQMSIDQLNKIQSISYDESVLASLPNIEDVEEYQIIAKNAVNFVNSTKRERFYHSLDVQNNDPENLKTNLQNLLENANQLLAATNNVLNEIDLIYLDRGNLAFKQNKIDNAIHNFNKAIEHNPQLTPAHYMLAVIAFNAEDYNQAEDILKNIFFNLGGDSQILADAKDLSVKMYDTYLTNADRNISAQAYEDALGWLARAQNWCNSINQVPCTNDLNTKFTITYEGIMNNMLGVVDQKISSNQLNEAEDLLSNAITFRNEHVSFLQNTQAVIDRSNKIYRAYISKAENEKQLLNFDNAIEDLLSAKNFCSNSNFINCPADINTKITNTRQAKYDNEIITAQNQINTRNYDDAEQTLLNAESYRTTYNLRKASKYDTLFLNVKQKQYDATIADGRSYYTSTKYQDAINKYDVAKNIEGNYNVRKNSNLPAYIKSAAKQLVLQKINAAETEVVNNNLDLARQYTQEAHDITQRYNLSTDQQITTAFESIDKKIFNQQCINYKNESSQYYNLALSSISSDDYLAADNYLQQAISIATVHIECSISMTDAKNKKQEVADAVEYQNLLKNANNFNSSRNYQSTIDEYIKAGNFYKNNNLNTRFGLYHKPLADFIKNGTNDFVLFGVNYFIRTDNPDNSLKMLKTLQSRNYNKKLTKNSQLLLGVKIAERDFSNQPNGTAKVLVLQYTNGNKWYKYFTKSYKRTWKKLD